MSVEASSENPDARSRAVLSGPLRIRHAIDDEVAWLMNRPPTPGGIGEVVAAAIFDIELEGTSVPRATTGSPRPAASRVERST